MPCLKCTAKLFNKQKSIALYFGISNEIPFILVTMLQNYEKSKKSDHLDWRLHFPILACTETVPAAIKQQDPLHGEEGIEQNRGTLRMKNIH